jgi:hypothetical protein
MNLRFHAIALGNSIMGGVIDVKIRSHVGL